MKSPHNIEEIADLQPDLMGFIFYSQSQRFVGQDFKIPSISATIQRVGVFVNETTSEILRKTVQHQLDFVQLHGNETPEQCQKLAQEIKVIKAFGVNENFDFQKVKEYESCSEFFLFDTKTKKHGGSGRSFDWNLLKNLTTKTPYFLSGGISLSSVNQLNEKEVYGVDVNSQFEILPGEKNKDLLEVFVNQLNKK